MPRSKGQAAAAEPDENPNRPREWHGRRTLVVALLVFAAIAGALWIGTQTGGSPLADGAYGLRDLPPFLNPAAARVAAEPGALAPDFELETLDGGRFRLSDWRGHPILLNFWASWCVPCRREVPVLIRLQKQYRADGLIIVGVNIEEARSPAQRFVDEFGINYVAPMDFSGEITRKYLRIGPPNTYFIRPDGTIESVFFGQAPDDIFEEGTAALLAQLAHPLGPAMLPGPKALPVDSLRDEIEVGGAPGQLAADFVAALATGPAAFWRLSDQRGTPVALAFLPPGCRDCERPAREALALLQDGGYGTVLLGDPGLREAFGPWLVLAWRDDVAERFGVGAEPRVTLIDDGGIIRDVLPLEPGAVGRSLRAARTAALEG